MSAHHPTTAALLAALRRDHAADFLGSEAVAALRAWGAAGCPDAPVPRFVPTEPGWYWRRMYGEPQPVLVFAYPNGDTWWRLPLALSGEPVVDDGLWLGPVAPWSEPLKPGEFLDGVVKRLTPSAVPPKPRTADEARANPLPGDMWQEPGGRWYVVVRQSDSRPHPWVVRWSNGTPGACPPAEIGEPGETYLGNFPADP